MDTLRNTAELTADVQGNILRGYRKSYVRHLVLRVKDPAAARRWLAAAGTSGADRSVAPLVTDAADWAEGPPEVCFNIGITHQGLVALEVPANTLDSFSDAYRQGMAARAEKVGDHGDSAPDAWLPWYRPSESVHLIVSLHADGSEPIDEFEQQILRGVGATAFDRRGHNDGSTFDGDFVHFGYRDNISQPRFDGVTAPEKHDDQPFAPLGTVLLGHPTAFEQLTWQLPDPPELGRNGAFNAFRVLEQDVSAFDQYLSQAADELLAHPAAEELLPAGTESNFGSSASRHDAMREVVAAKLGGRWRSGTPLELSPHDPDPDPPVSDTDFDYVDDVDGQRCPFGSHTRRANPRGGKIVQRVANHTRRLVRRGIPYGPRFDPGHPDDTPRGLLGNFLCADLAAQFEAVQYDWINLGLQDPRITGSNDPLLGANEAASSWFELPTSQGPIRLRDFPRFVRTRGGAYTFLPSLSGLRSLGA